MADPFSVSASIAGLVTLADVVFRRTFAYVKAVKGASKDISALSSEIGALYGLLNSLRLVSLQLEGEDFESTTRIHHVHSCYETLEKVKTILAKDEALSLKDDRIEIVKRKLRWPFTSLEVKTLILEIERHKQTLSLALNVDNMAGMLQALSRQNDIRDAVEDIRTIVKDKREAECRITLSSERRRILDSFGEVDPRKNHDMSRKLRQPSTGLWLTEGTEFRNWLLSTESARLWLFGIPGAGKTVLAASIIDEALQISCRNTAIAYFYCDYKDPKTQTIHSILGSIAQQIAKLDDQSFEKLQSFCDTYNPDHRKNFEYDLENLDNLIIEITSSFDSTMIIVDALDECGANTGQVVDILASLSYRQGSSVKTLFLSRDELELRERLESWTQVSIAARSSDLKLYVASEIELRIRQRRLRIKDNSLKEYIMEQLVEGAEGMYVLHGVPVPFLCLSLSY